MANLKFSQFTEQTDTANVQFLVGYNGSTNVRIAPGNIGGTVTSVTTGDANTITIGGTAAAPTVAANTAAVTNGSLNLATGDQIYDFVIAQNYTSNTGTVTSVATTHAGNAFTATIGNVSTVNPSVDITLNGSSSQYIDGAGNLTTFPTITTGTVESVGLSMPAAFSVTNSPVTTLGTLTVTGAGTTSQYVDGTGALQTFPTIPTVPANIVETVTTTDGTFIDLTPNAATDGAVTVTADLSATGTPNSSSYLRGDNTWAAISGGFTSFDITGGSGSAQTITDGLFDITIGFAHLHDLRGQAVDDGFGTHNQIWTGAIWISCIDAVSTVHLGEWIVIARFFIRAACGWAGKVEFPIEAIRTGPIRVCQQQFSIETDVRARGIDLVHLDRQHIRTVVHVQSNRVFVQLGFVTTHDFTQGRSLGVHKPIGHVATHDFHPVEVNYSAVVASQPQQPLHSRS